MDERQEHGVRAMDVRPELRRGLVARVQLPRKADGVQRCPCVQELQVVALAEGEACLVSRNDPMHDSVPYLFNDMAGDTETPRDAASRLDLEGMDLAVADGERIQLTAVPSGRGGSVGSDARAGGGAHATPRAAQPGSRGA